MSGYGTHTWRCGRCGESYSASGVVGDLQVQRFGRDHMDAHKEQDKMAKMTSAERNDYLARQLRDVAAISKQVREWRKKEFK